MGKCPSRCPQRLSTKNHFFAAFSPLPSFPYFPSNYQIIGCQFCASNKKEFCGHLDSELDIYRFYERIIPKFYLFFCTN
uniref:Uncharacterized protein n=1 Tax=Meloidogyne enterolobii TaxID=390850 RepID=A0A6V7WVZ8_MELEN|nr:unnamed protein product [Meloidogyne enterolobii]